MAMPTQITLSSSGISRALNLDWMSSKFTSFAVTGSSSGTFSVTVEAALDDIQVLPAAAIAWFALSTAALIANSSINLYQGPLAAIRLNASAMSSAVLTLRVLQGIGT